jgi:hypothetical protein
MCVGAARSLPPLAVCSRSLGALHVGFAPFLVGNRFLHLFDLGCTLISRASLSVED